ncbi:phosphomannomutase [Corallincola platygyrae]|uniref:Phosphomannomutase n=1 Tax=Corallincola platygyrae TaxID=1193278 RepID=A0ABW4XQY7_9GAMM
MFCSSKVIATSGVAFGTSGARGLVTDFTPDVCAAFTHAFATVMKGSFEFDRLALAIDNRPSSYDMAMACARALEQLGIEPVYYGVVPTPALAYVAMEDRIPCIMVTGSHIPFDRNGLKFYRPDGEISKQDESDILAADVEFAAISEIPSLSADVSAGVRYVKRYQSLFDGQWLQGRKIGVYEHSSAGRDLYATLFEELGAEVVALERSNEFVPIDTEAVSDADREKARGWVEQYGFDSIFSTDGDGDRPLISDEKGEWLRGDILGLLCADALNVKALAVPVSCNTAIEKSERFAKVARTKIGSPYVIAAFPELSEQFSSVAGFEANGGFLLGSDMYVDGHELKALPTRDALLPALMLLAASRSTPISSLVEALPQRFTHSDRIKEFATEKSQQILAEGAEAPQSLIEKLGITEVSVTSVDITDGLRMTLSNGCIVHLRPSGNAPELRCYAEADTFEQARSYVDQSLKMVRKLAG